MISCANAAAIAASPKVGMFWLANPRVAGSAQKNGNDEFARDLHVRRLFNQSCS
jgi:hypothetical protein